MSLHSPEFLVILGVNGVVIILSISFGEILPDILNNKKIIEKLSIDGIYLNDDKALKMQINFT